MVKRCLILAVACGGMMGTHALTFGQGLLDQQLGDKPTQSAKPTDPAKNPAATADKTQNSVAGDQKAPSPEGDIISPEAVKKVDDQELINKLTKPGDKPNPQQAAAQMKAMLDHMSQSQQKLATDKDPGEVTQETQRRIVMDLDVMIELARQMQQSSSGPGSGQNQPNSGQARQQSDGNQSGRGQGGNVANTGEALPGGGQADAATGDMRNHDPANWGSLPPRDRDQVSHGANEEYLPSYKELIDRYYQALAEMGKGKK